MYSLPLKINKNLYKFKKHIQSIMFKEYIIKYVNHRLQLAHRDIRHACCIKDKPCPNDNGVAQGLFILHLPARLVSYAPLKRVLQSRGFTVSIVIRYFIYNESFSFIFVS